MRLIDLLICIVIIVMLYIGFKHSGLDTVFCEPFPECMAEMSEETAGYTR